METSNRIIILNNNDWEKLYNNLTHPSYEYIQSSKDYEEQLKQSLDIQETEQGTIIQSNQIDFNILYDILMGCEPGEDL